MWYAPKLGDQGLKVSEMKKREEVWRELKSSNMDKMDDPVPFYPETCGHEVCTIKSGKCPIQV